MSSTEYMMWFLVMAVLIPVIVHGGTTWAYFRGAQQRAVDAAVDHGHRAEHRAVGAPATSRPRPVPASEDDHGVPEKQIWRWYDDGGAIAREPRGSARGAASGLRSDR